MADLQSAALASWLRRHFARMLEPASDLRQGPIAHSGRQVASGGSFDWIGQLTRAAESIVPKNPSTRILSTTAGSAQSCQPKAERISLEPVVMVIWAG